MAEINDTQVQNPEANPNGAENIPHHNHTFKIQNDNEGNITGDNKPAEKTYSQKDLDGAQAKARGTAERETKRKLLAQLGLKEDEEGLLDKFKQAYQDSLSEEEKRNAEMTNLQTENAQLSKDLEEKDYIIKALIELTGKNESDVDKIVKMAKGLKTESNTIEDAIKEVISMVHTETTPATTIVTNTVNPDMPTSNSIQQPSTTVVDVQDNPFKAGQINLTEQGKLIRTNPELAKKLAAEAGVKLKF